MSAKFVKRSDRVYLTLTVAQAKALLGSDPRKGTNKRSHAAALRETELGLRRTKARAAYRQRKGK